MKTTPLIAILALFLTSCVTGPDGRKQFNPYRWGIAHQAELKETGEYLLKKATAIGLEMVAIAATSPQDASKKSDLLDSLSYGYRTADKSNLIGKADYEALAKIWAGDKTHWVEVGGQLFDAVEESGLSTETGLEIIAKGLNFAAAQTRQADTAP